MESIDKKRPYVWICSTVSADGKLSTFERQQIDLATQDLKDFRAINRAAADAVMVGGRTFMSEDPSLTIRNHYPERFRIDGHVPRDPVKVAVVTRLEPMGASNFLDRGDAQKIIFTTRQTRDEAIDSVAGRAEVILVGRERVDLRAALHILGERFGVGSLMVEGGGTLNFALLKLGLIDEIRLKVGNLFLGGRDAPTLLDGAGFTEQSAPAARLVKVDKFDPYSCVLYYRIVPRSDVDKPAGMIARTRLPTLFGDFDLLAIPDDYGLKENAVLCKGEVKGRRRVPVRMHSECLTGDAFGSYRCDCREQLELSMRMISELGAGLVIYLRQEGRGNGLLDKIRIYELMDQGHNTLSATRELGIPVDARGYEYAADVLRLLGVESVSLITNNPDKARWLINLGIEVEETLPVIVAPNEFNRDYLQSKRELFQHTL